MKLFAFDVDGTLINNHNIILKDNLKERLNEILKRGDAIVIASGRPYPGIIQIFNQLGEGKRFCACSNGSLVTDINGNTLYECGLKAKDFYEFIKNHQSIMNNPHSNIYCYSGLNYGYFKNDYWTKFEAQANGDFKGINLKKHPLDPNDTILKFMIASRARRSKYFDEKQISDEEKKKFSVVRSSEFYIEFINKDSDKANAVEFLRQYLNIDEKDVYTFGDSGNDVKMIERFNGVAMGNAIDGCKKVAKFITKSVDEDGIIYALDNFVK